LNGIPRQSILSLRPFRMAAHHSISSIMRLAKRLKRLLVSAWMLLPQPLRSSGPEISQPVTAVEEVSTTDTSLRRVPPVLVVTDPKVPGGRRASSAAFSDDPDGSSMSVYMESIVGRLGLSEIDVVYGKPARWAVAAIPVQKLVQEEQRVEHDPIADSATPHPCDPAHGLVHGDKSQKRRRERIAAASPLIYVAP
jgi:hypothetical protein